MLKPITDEEQKVINYYNGVKKHKTMNDAKSCAKKGNFICLVNLPNGESFYIPALHPRTSQIGSLHGRILEQTIVCKIDTTMKGIFNDKTN